MVLAELITTDDEFAFFVCWTPKLVWAKLSLGKASASGLDAKRLLKPGIRIECDFEENPNVDFQMIEHFEIVDFPISGVEKIHVKNAFVAYKDKADRVAYIFCRMPVMSVLSKVRVGKWFFADDEIPILAKFRGTKTIRPSDLKEGDEVEISVEWRPKDKTILFDAHSAWSVSDLKIVSREPAEDRELQLQAYDRELERPGDDFYGLNVISFISRTDYHMYLTAEIVDWDSPDANFKTRLPKMILFHGNQYCNKEPTEIGQCIVSFFSRFEEGGWNHQYSEIFDIFNWVCGSSDARNLLDLQKMSEQSRYFDEALLKDKSDNEKLESPARTTARRIQYEISNEARDDNSDKVRDVNSNKVREEISNNVHQENLTRVRQESSNKVEQERSSNKVRGDNSTSVRNSNNDLDETLNKVEQESSNNGRDDASNISEETARITEEPQKSNSDDEGGTSLADKEKFKIVAELSNESLDSVGNGSDLNESFRVPRNPNTRERKTAVKRERYQPLSIAPSLEKSELFWNVPAHVKSIDPILEISFLHTTTFVRVDVKIDDEDLIRVRENLEYDSQSASGQWLRRHLKVGQKIIIDGSFKDDVWMLNTLTGQLREHLDLNKVTSSSEVVPNSANLVKGQNLPFVSTPSQSKVVPFHNPMFNQLSTPRPGIIWHPYAVQETTPQTPDFTSTRNETTRSMDPILNLMPTSILNMSSTAEVSSLSAILRNLDPSKPIIKKVILTSRGHSFHIFNLGQTPYVMSSEISALIPHWRGDYLSKMLLLKNERKPKLVLKRDEAQVIFEACIMNEISDVVLENDKIVESLTLYPLYCVPDLLALFLRPMDDELLRAVETAYQYFDTNDLFWSGDQEI